MIINNTVNNKRTKWGLETPQYTPPAMGTKTTTPMYGKNPPSGYKFTTGGVLSPVQDLSQGYTPTGNTSNSLKGLLSPVQDLSKYQTGGAPTYKPPVTVPANGVNTPTTYTPSNRVDSSTIDYLNNQVSSLERNLKESVNSGEIKGTKKPSEPLSYSSIVRGLVDASKPGSKQKGLVSKLEKNARDVVDIGEQARDISEKYGNEIARIGNLGAGAVAGDLSTGTNVVGSGNAAIASQSVSSRMSALSDAQQAELQGLAKQLEAQGYSNEAISSALAGVNTMQTTQIGGLGSAANYAQPSTAGYGQTVFDPLTGTFTGGQGGLDPQTVANTLATAVRNGSMTYEQAVSSLGYAGGAGQQFLNNALGPGFNPTLSTATIGGQANVLGQLPALESADTAAEGIKNKITTYLQANPSINPSALNAAGVLQKWIAGQTSDPKYQTFLNYLNEYTNTLAPILGVGGDPTNLKTQIAQNFVNAAASGQSIAEVLENMQGLSRGKIRDLRSGATGGGVVSSPYTGTGTGTGSIFDW